ncbi:MAG: O-antigen ligase family protein [Lachnospiraceae bacterium]|nr:O-antigen ligase family protein [Lachnospiraceae bacterium]
MEKERIGTDYGQKLAEGICFLLLVEIFYFYNNYVTIGGFGVGYQYIGCIVLVAVGGICFLVSPDVPYLYHSMKPAGMLAMSYLAAVLYTTAIWIFSFTPIRQMISGFFEPSYMVLCAICAAVTVYILREKAVTYAFWAMTTAFGLLLLPKLTEYGPAEFLRRLIAYVSSGGLDGGGINLEDTSFCYTYVFFALYFLFHRKEEAPGRMFLRLAVTVFAILDTFKRSGLFALAVSFFAAFAYVRMPEKYRRWFLNAIVIGFALSAFLYIPVVRYGLFNRIMDALNINTSSRTTIYNYYNKYYEFSPTYLGRGLGWTHRLVADADRFNVGLQSVNVHCDYVKHYIELGFWGYLLWMLLVFPWLVKKTVKGDSVTDDAVVLGVCIAMAVLRLTENISYLYSAVLGMGIIVVKSVLNGRNKRMLRDREEMT